MHADCGSCFGLCCVALPYAKTADFAFDKDSGTPCRNLQEDYRCSIHQSLREKGFKGCTVYECFGAGQKVSQTTYGGVDWRSNPASAREMFDVFPIMQQLHEMLYYLHEAMSIAASQPLLAKLEQAYADTEKLTLLQPVEMLQLDVPAHRAVVGGLLGQASEEVRAQAPKGKPRKVGRGLELLGAKLRGADLRAHSFRGALLIAADLRDADLRVADLIGADLRDADLSGADLRGCLFLTQVQINAAKGSRQTKLPPALQLPRHWQ